MSSVDSGVSSLNSALNIHSGIMEKLIGALMAPFPTSVTGTQPMDVAALRTSALQEQGVGRTVNVTV